jgi:hypothetical protein
MRHKLVDVHCHKSGERVLIATIRVPEYTTLDEAMRAWDSDMLLHFINRQLKTDLMNQAHHYDRHKEYLPGFPTPEDV